MGSVTECYSNEVFELDPKWVVDPQHLFVGPKIGEGAHAKIYEGKYKNKTVAIKIVKRGESPEEIAKRESRFAREVSMLSRVQHKNLVEFIGACKEPIMVIVTELLLGGTLRKYLVSLRPGRLDMRLAVGFALDIARAMECLHSHGVIHRDLKPENLILTADYKTVKLADFGLAREESLTEMMTAETGTYRWMAPENLRPSADDLPGDLAMIVTSCWKEDPNYRPNFTEIIQMLLRCLSTFSAPELVPPSIKRVFSSENAVLPPESPGTCSLMAVRDGDQIPTDANLQQKQVRGSFFFCCFIE
ncbi:PREDICTED: serine/threonine-protein kinase HT1-like isoform X2 [Camelina sativa]|uniref:Serine/threonine-protein kinase HT1-like isoform X2 n=1 Tax=Camelina sativa TaxID=90675 RepID=A0ABM0V4J5_CAMSA|nr:PREDICTED: serine/threonine-protein kinase HT1-like isoform X2 [Camelina sativa]